MRNKIRAIKVKDKALKNKIIRIKWKMKIIQRHLRNKIWMKINNNSI